MTRILEPETKTRGQGRPATADANQLEQLKRFTKIVADTSEFASIKEFAPQDATTNPSLILKSVQNQEYGDLLDQAMKEGQGKSVADIADALLVLFGTEILKVVPGRVSTETDANLSFNKDGLVRKARRFVELYNQRGVPRERVLIKIASTWEGIRAADILQREGINCNMTLLFCLPQAVACAEAGAKLISPFVGRILDWHKKKTGQDFTPTDDPGVVSVRNIYAYYKKFGYTTEVMGASFRNKGEIIELAGCDLLTISPKLLAELSSSTDPVARKLRPESASEYEVERLELDEKQFRWALNEDAMATEKLAEGIRTFHADAMKLYRLIEERR